MQSKNIDKNIKKTVLLIDDTRDEGSVGRRVDIIARNYWTGIECLKLKKWDVLLLDHDLNSFVFGTSKEYTGYDIMLFLEEHPEHLPEEIIFVTSNPPGRARMIAAYEAIKRRLQK